MKRSEVYTLIDGERDYQDKLGPERTDGRQHTVGDYLLMLDVYVARAKEAWVANPGDEQCLEIIRKCAGICVHCMEDWSAPARKE